MRLSTRPWGKSQLPKRVFALGGKVLETAREAGCLFFFMAAVLGVSGAAIDLPINSIHVFPKELSLTVSGAAHGLIVTGVGADGSEVDLTDAAEINVDSHVVEVRDGRVIVPRGNGIANLTVRAGGQTRSVQVNVGPAPEAGGMSFVNDVLPLLSKAGCNAGKCHAKPEGQNGFKLSVFAFDPKSDYEEIVKEGRGRRIVPGAPEESLILQKPTMGVDHGGGRRFEAGSDPYETLVAWIRGGMPYRTAQDPDLERIEIYPSERIYRKTGAQQLLVRAHYSNGASRDVTELAEFESNEKEITQVDESGRVQVGTLSGEGVIVARFMGLVAISRITVPPEKSLPEATFANLPVHNEIDELAYARLRKLGLAPSKLCSDSEFIRRASLDAIGRLPEPEEARAFLADPDPEKRRKWIARLLEHPAYSDHWGTKWADLIRPNPDRVGVKSVFLLDQWLRESFRQNKPYDKMAREILTAKGSTHEYGPTVVFRDRRNPEEVTTLVSQIFLGVRMECAKCHHHPNEKWSQSDFYQLAAFFGEVKRKGTGISPPISGGSEVIYHAPGGTVQHPVTAAVLKPKPPDGTELSVAEGADPRAALADWMMAPENPFFARAVVNRVWAEFMGRGLVEPVDDFRGSNPASNEPLLEALARRFVEESYDLKKLMRTIMESRLYQLSSMPNETNLEDTINYSRAYRRRLPAEVLLDAVDQVAGVPSDFQGLPAGSRASEAWNFKINSEFLDAFGRPNSSSDCPCERDTRPSLVQSLHLMNSTDLHRKIGNKEGRARQLAKSGRPVDEIITEIYLAAYSRNPEPEEMEVARRAFTSAGASRETGTEDLMWALINSAEFVFNH